MSISNNQILIIVLATAIPLSILVVLGILLRRRALRRRLFFNRGITPINDEEIESWKIDRSLEKKKLIIETNITHTPIQHQQSDSVGSIRKPPSVIVYHPRRSEEMSPRSLYHSRSMDMPTAQIVARAPNSRPGLTDDAIQGDDAFIPPLKRQPSRLAKLPPSSPRHNRNRSSRSMRNMRSMSVSSHYWHSGHYQDLQFASPRQSNEYLPRAGQSLDLRQSRKHSQSNQPRMSFDDEVFLAGLSPRPLIRKSEIGRAIG